MTPEERKQLIDRYADGHGEVVRALEGLSEADLSAHPVPGKWSAREIVLHLGDSETISGLRLRRLLIENNPLIPGYDEAEYARHFRYQERPWEPALRAFEAARTTTAQLLDSMTETDWRRTGTHSESGPYSAEAWLRVYADHGHVHANQIRNNRAAWTARAR